MGRMRIRLLLTAAVVAGCAPERSPTADGRTGPETAAEMPVPQPAAPGRLPDPPPPPPAAPGLPGLLPLAQARIEAELGAGPRCTLSDGGPPLMAASRRGAIANDGGRLVRLQPEASDWAALSEGGRFIGSGLAIEVDAGAVVGSAGRPVVRDASVTVTRGRRGFSVSHGPRWACGA